MSRKKYEPFANPLHLATGVSFFPCLVSGPIERQNKLVPQLLAGKAFDYTMATYGLKQIAWGLFEKKVIADNLAVYVDKVFDDMDYWTGAPLLVGSMFFTIQIYCDFAGYSDMALGVAKLFGIELTKNFDSPYFSKSLQEFWRRWHISLSSWFRDYVYIPLGGNRKGGVRKNINVIITMLVSGIWHGAAWTFIAWGGIHGLIQALENIFGLSKKKTENKLVNSVRVIVVFIIVNALWVFFRANSFADAWYLFAHQFDGITSVGAYTRGLITLGINPFVYTMIPIIFELTILFIHDYLALKMDVINALSAKPVVVRGIIYVLFVLMIFMLSSKGGAVKFVYAGF
jgi:D-alanyl-lipoteichoic acid acyltransferase DltB (MBOAT superfamily)